MRARPRAWGMFGVSGFPRMPASIPAFMPHDGARGCAVDRRAESGCTRHGAACSCSAPFPDRASGTMNRTHSLRRPAPRIGSAPEHEKRPRPATGAVAELRTTEDRPAPLRPPGARVADLAHAAPHARHGRHDARRWRVRPSDAGAVCTRTPMQLDRPGHGSRHCSQPQGPLVSRCRRSRRRPPRTRVASPSGSGTPAAAVHDAPRFAAPQTALAGACAPSPSHGARAQLRRTAEGPGEAPGCAFAAPEPARTCAACGHLPPCGIADSSHVRGREGRRTGTALAPGSQPADVATP